MDSRPAASVRPPRRPPIKDFSALARRLMGWTANLLATALALILALTLGRETIGWWRGDPPAPPHTPAPVSSALSEHISISAGDDGPRIERGVFHGDEQGVLNRLADDASRALTASPAVGEACFEPDARLLGSLSGEQPLRTLAAGEVYRWPGELPIVLALRRTEGQQRVVHWGLALPESGKTWSLLGISERSAGPSDTMEIALPPASRNVLLLGGAGTATRVFTGQAEAADWVGFYRRWFDERHWRSRLAWHFDGRAWHAVYVQPQTGEQAELHLSLEASGRLRGVIIQTASVSPQP